MKNGNNVTVFNGVPNKLLNYESQFKYNIIQKKLIYGNRFKILTILSQLSLPFRFIREFRKTKFDYIIPKELTSLPVGVLGKFVSKGKPKLIFDNSELSVERYSGIKSKIWHFLQKKLLKHCDYILYPENNRLEYYIKKYSIQNKMNILLENYPIFEEQETIKNDKNIIYLGGISEQRNTFDIIKAFEGQNEFKLDIVGFGDNKYIDLLKKYITEKSIRNIRILPPVRTDEITKLLENYSIGLAFYKNNNLNNYYCAPNKVYQYLHAGMCVITNNYPGLLSLIKKNNVGVCIEQINSNTILEAVKKVYTEKMHENLSENFIKTFSWQNIENKFTKIFEIESVDK